MRIPRYEAYRRLLIEPARLAWVRGGLAVLALFLGIPAIQAFVEPDWLKWFGTACALSAALYLLGTINDRPRA